jgi:hypothetical protein
MTHPVYHPRRHRSVIVRSYRWVKQWLRKKADVASLTDWIMAFLTLAIVYLAWSGGHQTDALIAAANKNAEAADKFSQSAKSINDAIQSAVDDFKRMTDANQTSADAATDSANTAKAALEVSERAFVGVINIALDKDLVEGQDSKITATFANGGKTPAFDMHTRHYMRWGPKAVLDQTSYSKVQSVSTDILLPTVQFVQATLKVTGIPKQVIDLIHSGDWVLEAYGIVEYRDVFKKKRITKYSFLFDPANPTLFIVREKGNEAN